jgi:large subunit ribosomal protein L5
VTTEQDAEKTEKPEQDAKAEGATRRTPARRTTKAKAKTTATAGEAKVAKAVKAKAAKSKTASPRGGGAKAKRAPSKKTEPVEAEKPAPVIKTPPRMLLRFRDEIAPALVKEFEYTSSMQVPRMSKIILNIGIGAEAIQNSKAIEAATNDLTLISGQHPVTTRARKSIAGFKVREGMPMGVTVTLRDRRMYEFFDRLISSTLPRIRDFRGISRESFDGRGNYALGISEQVIFPEIDYNSIDRIRGLQVVIVTTARTDREGLRLLELFGVPFARPEEAISAA